MPTLAEQLGAFIAETAFEALPSDVIEDTKLRVLDSVGVSLPASPLDYALVVLRVARAWGGPAESSVIGHGLRLPAPAACLVNGTLAHGLDFDDTYLPGLLHVSANTVPAALATAEALGSSGRQLVAALALGNEVSVRLGRAGREPGKPTSTYFEQGFHATSCCGAIAAAGIVARLHGLDAGQTMHALAIAASTASGLVEANRGGGWIKRAHTGWAAHSGTVAAQLAAAGFTGPATALEGKYGFLNAYTGGKFDPALAGDGVGSDWHSRELQFKPYPCNHLTQPAVDAVRLLREQDGVRPDDVERIEVGVSARALTTVGEPLESKLRPATPYAAAFSLPFVTAKAFLGGGGLGLYVEDFTEESIRDERVLALTAKVRPFEDPESSASFPDKLGGVVRVHTKDGRTLERRVPATRGSREFPLSRADVELKFRLNAEQVLPAAQAATAKSLLARLDTLDSIAPLMEVLRRS
ncbi:MAG: MmgE/PrpD family protein [Chloroflexi bacterium]|nr:MmgE/PrpD family protein [Chloroflexota bacterium]